MLNPTVVAYRDGEMVFRQGDPGDRMYVVMAGAVRIFRQTGDTETVLGELGFGEMFGELSLFDQRPRSASARAVGATELRVITHEEFMELDCDMLIRKMLLSLADRLRRVNEAFERVSVTEGPEWDHVVEVLRDRDWLE